MSQKSSIEEVPTNHQSGKQMVISNLFMLVLGFLAAVVIGFILWPVDSFLMELYIASENFEANLLFTAIALLFWIGIIAAWGTAGWLIGKAITLGAKLGKGGNGTVNQIIGGLCGLVAIGTLIFQYPDFGITFLRPFGPEKISWFRFLCVGVFLVNSIRYSLVKPEKPKDSAYSAFGNYN